ncbi:rhodanese-like domain-containing protein [Desulfogranum marinum]|uniref:rhodanese-like domain-containing protein n=1 Tax=Desulfogranum marinum TaxID=453220 RepID=UPI0029C66A1D|nr:rhodanese-like domain-containing protein [Desulfogranum marinum]
MYKKFIKLLPGLLIIGLLSFGCAQSPDVKQEMTPKASQTQQQAEKNVYKGTIVGKSNKAKTISIEVGKGKQAQTMMVKFDDQTKGVEHAVKGHAAIITFEKRGNDVYAKVIKQKLAKLPQGVTEIKTEELSALVTNAHKMYLVDSRPASRYGQSHLPGAVSIPVPMLKEKQSALLPADKNELLIFYCGGPT